MISWYTYSRLHNAETENQKKKKNKTRKCVNDINTKREQFGEFAISQLRENEKIFYTPVYFQMDILYWTLRWNFRVGK